MHEIEPAKQRFLDRFNPQRTVERAFDAAIVSAVQRNPLYGPRAPRADIRARWRDELQTISTDAETYEGQLVALTRRMNADFGAFLRIQRHPRYGYDPGFRISHAQKSVAVCLKHLWCLGRADVPPQCPIDSTILRAAGLRYPETRWQYVNTITEHRRKLRPLSDRATDAGMSVAEWELLRFAP